ncbi:MAG: tetratricopeptide repeat protein [Candidatus Hydrogenedentes bacterium]|nr:tetratricopeptide repeat protein [Candidatus Hydrogenedentota bacterium]
MRRLVFSSIAIFLVAAGCATTHEGPATISESKSPAWSAKAIPNEMQVSVSPAGKTLRVLGSSGMVLGAGADAIVNAKYRAPIHASLEGYDAAEVYKGIIKSRLETALGTTLAEVSPMGSTAGAKSVDEAIDARYRSIGKNGSDLLLDCELTFGVYGPEGVLATKLDGKLVSLPDGHRLWDNTIVATTEPILANAKLGDPTSRMGANVTNPDFTVDEEKVNRWTADGGAILKQRFELAANAAVSAMMADLGIGSDALGEYTLGVHLMNEKKFAEAATHYEKALQLDPNLIDARNAHAVNMAHNDQVDDAIAAAKSLTDSNPGYAPAWYNLAYWYAEEKKDPASAQVAYDKALALGVAPDPGIEKAIKKAS